MFIKNTFMAYSAIKVTKNVFRPNIIITTYIIF